jgi:hypothetical protein
MNTKIFREFSGHIKVLLIKLMSLMVQYNNIIVTLDMKIKFILGVFCK